MAIFKAHLSRGLAFSLGGLVVGICAMTIAQTQTVHPFRRPTRN